MTLVAFFALVGLFHFFSCELCRLAKTMLRCTLTDASLCVRVRVGFLRFPSPLFILISNRVPALIARDKSFTSAEMSIAVGRL